MGLCVDEVEVEVVCVEIVGLLDELDWLEEDVVVSRWVDVGAAESDVSVGALGTRREFLSLCTLFSTTHVSLGSWGDSQCQTSVRICLPLAFRWASLTFSRHHDDSELFTWGYTKTRIVQGNDKDNELS